MTKAEIQRIRSLREKAARDELGLFVVEGAKVVGELVTAGYPFEAIYATGMQGAPDLTKKVQLVTADEMSRISQLPTPSPVLAVARIVRRELAAGDLDHGWTLALDGIQDPGNVGTLLRIADWFGLDRALLSPGCADPFSAKVIAASMGSFARIATYTVDLPGALAAAKAPILGCDLSGDDVHEVEELADCILVIGSEGQGLSQEVRRHIPRCVTVPRHGFAESLNAAVAAGIICDRLRR